MPTAEKNAEGDFQAALFDEVLLEKPAAQIEERPNRRRRIILGGHPMAEDPPARARIAFRPAACLMQDFTAAGMGDLDNAMQLQVMSEAAAGKRAELLSWTLRPWHESAQAHQSLKRNWKRPRWRPGALRVAVMLAGWRSRSLLTSAVRRDRS